MFEAIRRAGARVLGIGEGSLAVPVFDGAYTPNNILEEAPVLFEHSGLEDLAIAADGTLFAACGPEILQIDPDGRPSTIAKFDAPVQALALLADGGMAVAVGGRILFEGGAEHGKQLATFEGQALRGVNALSSGTDGKLMIGEGSMRRPYPQWSHDLLEHGHTGRVLEYDPSHASTRVLASGLQYCFGVCATGGKIFASESWAHRIVELGDMGSKTGSTTMLDALPGYPARLGHSVDGGYWLSLFAGRTQLLEFILREDDFRKEMMRTVPPNYWFAPSLLSGRDYLEPQQTAGVMQMGIMKPWAPPRSYGLVVRLDNKLQPLYSLHSRAGGRHHGVVAAVESADHLFVLSKGAGRILRVPLAQLDSGLNRRSSPS